MRVVCNQPRKTGTAPPKRLTARQRQIVEQLISEHGDNHEVQFELLLIVSAIYVVYSVLFTYSSHAKQQLNGTWRKHS